MPVRPNPRLSQESLRRDLADRKARVGEAVARTSGVPLETWNACDPMVEAQLLDDVVMQVFLRYMGSDQHHDLPSPPDDVGEENRVGPVEIRALLEDAAAIEQEPAPDLGERLPQERLWVLVDIAKTGHGLARQRATVELRRAMEDFSTCAGIDRLVLDQLVRLLADAERHSEVPVLFRTLKLAAARALRQVGEEPR